MFEYIKVLPNKVEVTLYYKKYKGTFKDDGGEEVVQYALESGEPVTIENPEPVVIEFNDDLVKTSVMYKPKDSDVLPYSVPVIQSTSLGKYNILLYPDNTICMSLIVSYISDHVKDQFFVKNMPILYQILNAKNEEELYTKLKELREQEEKERPNETL